MSEKRVLWAVNPAHIFTHLPVAPSNAVAIRALELLAAQDNVLA